MRDLFAVLAIALAVVGLGIFRVPSEDAVFEAGLRAAAQTAMADEVHPVSISVERRKITVSGRVESRQAANAVLSELRALDGVEAVLDDLTILPDVQPFTLDLIKDADGVSAFGYVPRQSLARTMEAALGAEDGAFDGLVVATGAPDGAWSDVAVRAAEALALLERGQLSLSGHDLRLSGAALVPDIAAAALARLSETPEAYEVSTEVLSLDDGRPFRLVAARDPKMGLRVMGKLPQGTDRAALYTGLGTVREDTTEIAAVSRPLPGWQAALQTGLAAFADLGTGTLAVTGAETGGTVTLSGGPVAADVAARLADRAADLPQGYALHLALIPEDDGTPLAVTADFDGQKVLLTGHLPADTDPQHLAAALGDIALSVSVTHGPFPDLSGWADPLVPGLAALVALKSGRLVYDAEGLRVTGVAALPDNRDAARAALGGLGTLDAMLEDDGTPPRFTLEISAGAGARVSGKLPGGIKAQAIAEALGLAQIAGAPVRAPSGSAEPLIDQLNALAGWLGQAERVVVSYDDGRLAIEAVLSPGHPETPIAEAMAPVLGRDDTLALSAEDSVPLSGTRRVHAVTGAAQIFLAGHWLDELSFTPLPETCAARLSDAEPPGFAPGSLRPDLEAAPRLAYLAALVRACHRFGDLVLTIEGHAQSAGIDALNRQLSRRRAEAVRAALIDRGVPPEALSASGAGDTEAIGDVIRLRFAAE